MRVQGYFTLFMQRHLSREKHEGEGFAWHSNISILLIWYTVPILAGFYVYIPGREVKYIDDERGSN